METTPDALDTPPAPAPARGHRLFAFAVPPLAAMAVTALLFAVICRYSFVNFDDGMNLFANPHIVPVGSQRLGYFWTHSYYDLYMPVTYTLWGLLARIAPLAPPGLFIPGGGMSPVNP